MLGNVWHSVQILSAATLALLTGFYLGVGFSSYLGARAKLGYAYNVFAHVLMTFIWGAYLPGLLYRHARYLFSKLVFANN